MQTLKLLIILSILANLSLAVKLPGVNLEMIPYEQQIQIFASNLRHRELFTYFCPSEKTIALRDNFLDRMFDDSIHQMHFKVYAGVNQYCRRFCKRDDFIFNIDDYRGEFIKFSSLGLNAWTKNPNGDWSIEIPILLYHTNLDFLQKTSTFVNHFRFIFKYSEHIIDGVVSYKVNDLQVVPKSLASKIANSEGEDHYTYGCNYGDDVMASPYESILSNPHRQNELFFTYDTIWEKSDNPKDFTTRWDTRQKFDSYGYTRSLLSSLSINVFLVIAVYLLLSKMINKRILIATEEEVLPLSRKSRNLPPPEDEIDPNMWKYISGDVFRAPEISLVYCATIGTGLQLCLMGVTTLILLSASFGIEQHRGHLILVAIGVYLVTSISCGWFSAVIYKSTGGEQWILSAAASALMYPSIGVILINCINVLLLITDSTYSLSFWELLIIMAIWFGIFMPQVFFGSFLGFRRKPISFPCKVGLVPRTVPKQPVYLRKSSVFFLGGLFPFLTIYFQLESILNAFLGPGTQITNFSTMFMFMMIAGVLFISTSALIGVLCTYFMIMNGNHRWWWPSFIAGAGSGCYSFFFSILYQHSNPVFLLLFNILLSGFITLCSGSIASIAGLYFVRKMYSIIKID